MTELIRSWPDSAFYLSSVGSANALEQFTKLQTIAKLVRALSDSSTVDSTGSKLDERLTGLSFGNQTQRHKWRALYDTANDRFLIQRNSGTDASKTWVDKLRLDSAGNLSTVGTLTIASEFITAGKATLGGNLDANDFYVLNAGQVRTFDLVADGPTNLNNADTKIRGTKFFDIGYYSTTTTQPISGAETNITSLTGLTLPNTTAPLANRSFLVRFFVQVSESSGGPNLVNIALYSGPNGSMSDTAVYQSAQVVAANALLTTIPGQFLLQPSGQNKTKFGLSITSGGACIVQGASPSSSNLTIQEIVP